MRSPEGLHEAVGEIAELGPVHGLVHVAGGFFNKWAPIVTTSTEAWDDVVRLNLQSAFLTTRTVANHLLAQGTGGSIVHIASVSGLTAMPFGAAYSASKAGMIAFMRTAALELGSAGIRVNAVAPGTVRTPRAAESGDTTEDTPEEQAAVPLRRRGAPDDIAHAVWFLLSDLSTWITGQVLAVDGGIERAPVVPRRRQPARLRARRRPPREALRRGLGQLRHGVGGADGHERHAVGAGLEAVLVVRDQHHGVGGLE